jgi:hypothetical protein
MAMQIAGEQERTMNMKPTTDVPTLVDVLKPCSPETFPAPGISTQLLAKPGEQAVSDDHDRNIAKNSSQVYKDYNSLRRKRGYKRAEEPPLNQEGEMSCEYLDCRGLAFGRKSDWRYVFTFPLSIYPPHFSIRELE